MAGSVVAGSALAGSSSSESSRRKDDGSMTKSDLVESVSAKLQLPRGKAELIINGVFDCMERALRAGDRIEIRGFGSFEIRHYKAYEGRNPRTGDPVGVQPKRLPFFKVGKELKERVDGRTGELAAAEGAVELDDGDLGDDELLDASADDHDDDADGAG